MGQWFDGIYPTVFTKSRQMATHWAGAECCTYPLAPGTSTNRPFGNSSARLRVRSDVFMVLPSPTSTSAGVVRSEEHTSELQSLRHLVCRLLLEKKKKNKKTFHNKTNKINKFNDI